MERRFPERRKEILAGTKIIELRKKCPILFEADQVIWTCFSYWYDLWKDFSIEILLFTCFFCYHIIYCMMEHAKMLLWSQYKFTIFAYLFLWKTLSKTWFCDLNILKYMRNVTILWLYLYYLFDIISYNSTFELREKLLLLQMINGC